MRRVFITIMVVIVVLASNGLSQHSPPKPKISKKPLTPEQVSIYRVVLNHYLRDTVLKVRLANTTAPLELTQATTGSCFEVLPVGRSKANQATHRLDKSVIPDARLILVDRDEQVKEIWGNMHLEDIPLVTSDAKVPAHEPNVPTPRPGKTVL